MSRIEPTDFELIESEIRWREPKKRYFNRSVITTKSINAANLSQVAESYAWRYDTERVRLEDLELREVEAGEDGDAYKWTDFI